MRDASAACQRLTTAKFFAAMDITDYLSYR
jgi:hypothetical protein